MKIYLIGNYPLFKSKSMELYTNLLHKILSQYGYNVVVLKPKKILNKLNFKSIILKKYLSYIDKYFFFGLKLLKLKTNSQIHICDQSNSLLFPFIKSDKLSITCHDLINTKKYHNLNHTKENNFLKKIHQKLILYYLCKFKNIICVSQNTKNDLSKFTKNKKKNIKIIYNCLNKSFYRINKTHKKKLLKKYSINYNYCLHVGSNVWYKNKEALIHIFYNFLKVKNNTDQKLILAGQKNTLQIKKIINQLKIKKNIINIVNPSHKTLNTLYNGADCLIFPSITEGFGWPIIEAQACGCPVFTYKKNPMKEIGKDSVFYMNPLDHKKSASIVNNQIYKNKNNMINKGFKNLNRFNQDKIFTKYINFFNKINNF